MAARLRFAGPDIYDFVEEQRERLKKAYEALPDEKALDEQFVVDFKENIHARRSKAEAGRMDI